MGSGIAAQVANSSTHVILLDVASADPANRNSVLDFAIQRISTSRPPALSHPDKIKYITTGNLDDNLHLISSCDLIIEVIVEDLQIKHELYNKITPYIKNTAIVASNTSTLPLKNLKAKLSQTLQSRFVITHFFNPPRYMELLEFVTDSSTEQNAIKSLEDFLKGRLGKTIVKCNDMPGFIANRVGCFLLELVVRRAIDQKLDPGIIDGIFTTLFK